MERMGWRWEVGREVRVQLEEREERGEEGGGGGDGGGKWERGGYR